MFIYVCLSVSGISSVICCLITLTFQSAASYWQSVSNKQLRFPLLCSVKLQIPKCQHNLPTHPPTHPRSPVPKSDCDPWGSFTLEESLQHVGPNVPSPVTCGSFIFHLYFSNQIVGFLFYKQPLALLIFSLSLPFKTFIAIDIAVFSLHLITHLGVSARVCGHFNIG